MCTKNFHWSSASLLRQNLIYFFVLTKTKRSSGRILDKRQICITWLKPKYASGSWYTWKFLTDDTLILLTSVILEQVEFVSCGYSGGNENKDTFVLEYTRRACDAISKVIIVCEKRSNIGVLVTKIFLH